MRPVCNGASSAAQVGAYLTAISAAGARSIGVLGAGPVPPAGTDSRLPALARWVRGEVWGSEMGAERCRHSEVLVIKNECDVEDSLP